MVDFETICKISYTCSAIICVCDYYHFMSSIDELCRELVDMTFDSAWLGKEEIADHCDVVGHFGGKDRRAVGQHGDQRSRWGMHCWIRSEG